MNDEFVPKINCRFKIRQDIDCFLGFFQGKGVLTFNDVGAFIVKQMIGEKSLLEIEKFVRYSFPAVRDPKKEILLITEQLCEAGFL